jgi:hypothetical protein
MKGLRFGVKGQGAGLQQSGEEGGEIGLRFGRERRRRGVGQQRACRSGARIEEGALGSRRAAPLHGVAGSCEQRAFAAPLELARRWLVDALSAPDREHRQCVEPRPAGGGMRRDAQDREFFLRQQGEEARVGAGIGRHVRFGPRAIQACDAGEVRQVARGFTRCQEGGELGAVQHQARIRRRVPQRIRERGAAEPLAADQARDGRIVRLQRVDPARHHGVAVHGEGGVRGERIAMP